MAEPIDIEGISHSLIGIYLEKSGWTKAKTNRFGIDAFIEPADQSPAEIMLPNKDGTIGYRDRLAEAIRILSDIEEKDSSLVVRAIKNLDRDLHNYRIMTDSDSISMLLMEELLESAKESIKDAAFVEHHKYYQGLSYSAKKDIKGPRDEADAFINDCKFAHTWRGSFGITIEIPLWLPSIGLFDLVCETLGRRATKRVLHGFKIVDDAIAHNSYDYILEHITDKNDIAILSRFPLLQEHLKTEELNFSVDLSPSIKIDNETRAMQSHKITVTTLQYIEKAVEKIRLKDEEFDTEIMGFPETISSSAQDLLRDDAAGERKVVVRGTCRQVESLSVPMHLSLDDYKKAIRAQDEVKSVRVKCRIKKRLRGWEVTKLHSFELLE